MLPCILYVLEPLFRRTSLHWDKLPAPKQKKQRNEVHPEEAAASAAAL